MATIKWQEIKQSIFTLKTINFKKFKLYFKHKNGLYSIIDNDEFYPFVIKNIWKFYSIFKYNGHCQVTRDQTINFYITKLLF